VDLVWLRDSEQKTAIVARAWRSEPATRGISFYAPRFYRQDSREPWLSGDPIEWPQIPTAAFPPVIRRAVPDRQAFQNIHGEILNGIREKRFAKVVPFVTEEIEFMEPLGWRMCASAFADPGVQYAFGFECLGEGMCGVTPELLFRVRDGVLHTMALAGTARLDGPPLQEDPKESLEHRIVVDHIVEALSGLGSIEVEATRERHLPHLKHLLTPIQVKLREQPEFMDLVARLHPTAALGGHPRAPAMDFLRVRGGDRLRFGAPFGLVKESEMLCVVAIRSMQWAGPLARIMSGCGVVEGSMPDREWKELALKRRSTARQLGLEL
jgi:isochorismate synthase EntC